ncbi:ankyrin-1-like isoform X2 [Sitodiplosis mosellana]|uniref:ankyrin-1-like isoform X2 n=1 Tax=Sitodiplosis mosellana TaxID=263140 RepID=UPI0024442C0C|nr:ankyrin-1-like isoform X2 [Sitodiplosis mosellana]
MSKLFVILITIYPALLVSVDVNMHQTLESTNVKKDEIIQPPEYKIKELRHAIERGDVSKMRSLISEGINMSIQLDNGDTPIHLAARKDNVDIVKLLIDEGVSPKILKSDNSTPLHDAVQSGNVEVAKVLIEHGADVNAESNDGWTALRMAARAGHVEVAKVLIEHGADVNATDLFGRTALHWAAIKGNVEVTKVLIEHGADVNAKDVDGLTALLWASQAGKDETIKFLIEHGADVKATTKNIETALHYAARQARVELVGLLIKKGADVNAKDIRGNTALYWTVDDERKTVVKLLEAEAERIRSQKRTWYLEIEVFGWPFVILFLFIIPILLVAMHLHDLTSLQSRLLTGKLIGGGNFGDVYMGELFPINPFSEKKKVAVKTIKISKGTASKLGGTTELLAEINILKCLPKHCNVVGFIGAFGIRNALNGGIKILYEFCPYGDLRSFLKKNKPTKPTTPGYIPDTFCSPLSPLSPTFSYTKTDLLSWAAQVARGLLCLASNKPPIIHRDLAARNILLCDNETVKIGDFGLSRTLNGSEYYKKGGSAPDPVPWMAIESRQDSGMEQKFSVKSDVWSFGVVIWELFSDGDDPTYFTIEQLKNGTRLPQPKRATEEMYSLMLSCWQEKPEDRITSDDLEKILSKMHSDALEDDGHIDNDDESLITVRVDEANTGVSAIINLPERTSDATEENGSSLS